MQLTETKLQSNKHLEDAIRLLESHPDFARVQVQMRDRLQEAQTNEPPEAVGGGQRVCHFSGPRSAGPGTDDGGQWRA